VKVNNSTNLYPKKIPNNYFSPEIIEPNAIT